MKQLMIMKKHHFLSNAFQEPKKNHYVLSYIKLPEKQNLKKKKKGSHPKPLNNNKNKFSSPPLETLKYYRKQRKTKETLKETLKM